MDYQLIYSPLPNTYEAAAFENLWRAADTDQAGSLQGGKAVEFLKKSGLDMATLKKIWSLSTPIGVMNKEQFYVALRFIALVQNGVPPNMLTKENFINALAAQVSPPTFEGVGTRPGATSTAPPPALSPRGAGVGNAFSSPTVSQTGGLTKTSSTMSMSNATVENKRLSRAATSHTLVGLDPSWGPPEEFSTPNMPNQRGSRRDFLSPSVPNAGTAGRSPAPHAMPQPQTTPGNAVDVKRVVWINDETNMDDNASSSISSQSSYGRSQPSQPYNQPTQNNYDSYQSNNQQRNQSSLMQNNVHNQQQYQQQYQQQQQHQHQQHPSQQQFEYERRTSQLAQEQRRLNSEIAELESQTLQSLQSVEQVNEEVFYLQEQLKYLLEEQERVLTNQIQFRSHEEQQKYLSKLAAEIVKMDQSLQSIQSASSSPSREVNSRPANAASAPSPHAAPSQEFENYGMMYMSTSSKSNADGKLANNSLSVSSTATYEDEIRQKIEDTQKLSKVHATIEELRRVDEHVVDTRKQLDEAINQMHNTIKQLEAKKSQLRAQGSKYDPTQCLVSSKIKDLLDEKENLEGVLLVMYEELESQEIRMFSLRKELLLLSAADFREYEARRDKSTDHMDIKHRLADVCTLSSQAGGFQVTGPQRGYDNWGNSSSSNSRGANLEANKFNKFNGPASPKSAQHAAMEQELQSLRAELEYAQGEQRSKQKFFDDNHLRQQIKETKSQISVITDNTLEMEARAFAIAEQRSLANLTQSSFEISDTKSLSSISKDSYARGTNSAGNSNVGSISIDSEDSRFSKSVSDRQKFAAQREKQRLEYETEDDALSRQRKQADEEAKAAEDALKAEFDRLEQLKAERLASKERLEAERKAAEEAEIKRQAAALQETERRAKEMAAAQKAKADRDAAIKAREEAKAEADRIAAEIEQERLEAAAEEAERQRIIALRMESERKAAEAAAAVLIENQRLDRIKQLREQAARDAETKRMEAKTHEERAVKLGEDRYAQEFEAMLKAEMARKAAEARALELNAEADSMDELRLEEERREAELQAIRRAELTRLEAERQALARAEELRREAERQAEIKAEELRREAERLAALKAEKDRLEAVRRAEEERIEAEREAARKAEEERRAALKRAEEARLEAERLEAIRLEQEKLEAERQAQIRAEQARIEALRRAEEQRVESERKAEAARKEAEQKAEEARKEAERKAEEARKEAERRAEEARKEAERKAEEARKEAERKAEEIRVEAERQAAQRAEEARIAAERKADEVRLERIRREEAEKAELARQAAEAERIRQEELQKQQILEDFEFQKAILMADAKEAESQCIELQAMVINYNSDITDLNRSIAELQAQLDAAMINRSASIELDSIKPEADSVSSSLSLSKTELKELVDLEVQLKGKLESLHAQADAIRQNPLDIALSGLEREISALYEILGAMRLILLSYSDPGENIEAPVLPHRRAEELAVLKSANVILDGYKAEIMAKIREAKSAFSPVAASAGRRVSSISADPRSPLNTSDQQRVTLRPAVQVEKEAKPMSELEKRFAMRKGKANEEEI